MSRILTTIAGTLILAFALGGCSSAYYKTMEPVLEAFQDQVLVLKHNLNARAIGALRNELDSIERDTANLIAQMQKAIAEADAFIQSMKD
jgi:hypothetical protein